jgi:hypothetical protein
VSRQGDLVMDKAGFEFLRIAVKFLNRHYDHSDQVTEGEIVILKSYLGGDLANLAVDDIAATVIRRELARHPVHKAERPSATACFQRAATSDAPRPVSTSSTSGTAGASSAGRPS